MMQEHMTHYSNLGIILRTQFESGKIKLLRGIKARTKTNKCAQCYKIA